MQLYETYENNEQQVGVIETTQYDREYTLLPISHTTQNAHIEVNITEDGEFHSAFEIGKTNTLIPATEEASSRSGAKIAPYPLHDKLSYVAGDFKAYGGKVKKEEPFLTYIDNLERWAESSHAIPKVKSIYKYLKKGKLIADLVSWNMLFLDQDGNLIDKWDAEYEGLHGKKPKLFTNVGNSQDSAFIRFNVYSPTKVLTPVWEDKEMYDSFISYYKSSLSDEDLCYVTGEVAPSTERHANKIRNSADKAKLISSNDTSGFTFRGRFSESNQVANISYDVSQKAHNALKWLIQRQGKIIDNRVFLVWDNNGAELPSPAEDSFDIISKLNRKSEQTVAFTNRTFAMEVSKAIDGYRGDLDRDSNANIMILDSATTGRLGVLYYRNLNKELYLKRIQQWHSTCIWLHNYRKNSEGKFSPFRGAPATRDIAFAVYGPNASDKVTKELMERMLPCIVDERVIPRDIVKNAFHRASNPVALEKWEWEKTLSIACALINKKEGYDLPLDTENTDRDYLFGRLLAIADVLERRALGREETRATNAIRYMNAFSQNPARTWKTIQDSLQPYQARLGARGNDLSKLIDEAASKLTPEEFNNKPLSEKYLLGFYSQRHDLYEKKKNDEKNNEEESQQ